MEKEEAKKILDIMSEADGGCSYCIRTLFELFIAEWPEFKDIAVDIFENSCGFKWSSY